ncbi:MAG: ABC transporter permease [Planctomycetota bacterium]
MLTKAFFFGAIVFPLVAWGAIIGVTASGVFNAEKPPLEGTVAIVDGTDAQRVTDALEAALDPDTRAQQREMVERSFEQQDSAIPAQQLEQVKDQILSMRGLDRELFLTIERHGVDAPVDTLQQRLLEQDAENPLLAYAVIGEPSLRTPLPPGQVAAATSMIPEELIAMGLQNMGAPDEEDGVLNPSPDELGVGRFRIVHRKNLDPDYVSIIRSELSRIVQRERYRSAGIDPDLVRGYETQRPIADTRMVDDDGEEEDSTATAQRIIPIAFFMLLYISVLTGGNYLFMGTLEEKGSRVMEVLLSAVSPINLLVGKLVGQGLVGLTVLSIYLTLGLLAADRFGFLSAIPMDALPWMLPYFLMAYLFFGALFVAVGSAVTEVREAQSLFAPVTFLIILIFVILFPIMDNPGAPIARVMSYFPPATPFVMVMRMSQPSHIVPLWEVLATSVVGVLGVLGTIWIAAKIFRVGVLMYGKPPSFGTLLKWVMQS